MKKSELKQLIREEFNNLLSEGEFQDRMRLGKSKAKRERGIMMLMNKWSYDNLTSHKDWEIDEIDPNQINLYKRPGDSSPFKTLNLNSLIKSYPDIANKYDLGKNQLNESFFENTVLGNILILMWDSSVGGVLDRAKAKRMAQTIKSDPSLITKFKDALGEGGRTLKEFIQFIYYMTFGDHKI